MNRKTIDNLKRLGDVIPREVGFKNRVRKEIEKIDKILLDICPKSQPLLHGLFSSWKQNRIEILNKNKK